MVKRKASTIPTVLAILFFYMNSAQLFAQEEFISPPSTYITTIPFTILTGGIIIVHATIDDIGDTLNFVLDTGSGGISIDSSTCAYFKFKTEPSNKIVRGIAGMRAVDFTYNHTLRLPGVTVEKLDFHINDYELLTSAYGIKIDGIIGYSFFRRYIVFINYDEHIIRVQTPGTFKYPRGGYMLKPAFTTLPMLPLAIQDYNSVYTRFYFDTGAGICMLLNNEMTKDSVLFSKKKKMYPTEAEGLGGKASVLLTTIRSMKLGPYRFKKIPVYIFDDEFNVTSYPVLSGLVGNDILRRFNIILNYPEQQIYIKPNKHFSDSFDYSYTGLGFYLIDGKITVTDIMKNSPAVEAGFQINDIILGIDNNISNNIQTYKVLLQNAHTKVKVLILRNGSPIILTLKIKSIL